NSDVANYPNDTGDWLLDSMSHELSSDATSNTPGPFYYPFDPNAPQNHGKLPNGTANGKYSALVLVRSGATSLLNYEIEFDLLIEKRNHLLADAGAAVRWHSDPGTSLT